jgi:predicted RecB family nuclease
MIIGKAQGAYFAKQCPERVQLDVLRPCEPAEDSLFRRQLARQGDEFEAQTFDEIEAGLPEAMVLEGDPYDRAAWEQSTMAALSEGVSVVVGGRLPTDTVGRRTGEPDLLVRVDSDSSEARASYLPVDVKGHLVLKAAATEHEGTALVSAVTAPRKSEASVDPDSDARWRTPDLLQLAHYRRLLEHAGVACPHENYGGIIGTEGVLVWYDLDLPCLKASPYIEGAPDRLLSAMELYELEFAYRLKVFDAASAHVESPTATLLAEPIAVQECGTCRWRRWCIEQLEASADLSLLPKVTVQRRRTYRQHGVGDLHHLAALDPSSAVLVKNGVNAQDLFTQAAGVDGGATLASLIPRRKAQLGQLTALGLSKVADLARLDRLTVSVASSGINDLDTQIDLARARLGPSSAYRRRGVDRIAVPRGDIEIDVDMENVLGGCYLWGALITDRRPSSTRWAYVPFVNWGEDLEQAEAEAFTAFWTWLAGQREAADNAGASFRAYCYNEGAENGQMTKIADRLGMRRAVDSFISSDAWVDLLPIVRENVITGRSMGLKLVAPLAGFAWRSDDAGGDLAMVRYGEAIDTSDPDIQAAAQRWILDYNEDDCAATAAVRQWLDREGATLPSIADADGWPQ